MRKKRKSMDEKIRIILLLMVILCVQLTACGKKEAQMENEASDYVYVPEHLELKLGNAAEVDQSCIINHELYYSVYSSDKETEEDKTGVYRVKLEKGAEAEKLPIELKENERVVALCAEQDGNLILILYTSAVENENRGHAVATWNMKKVGPSGNVIYENEISDMIQKETMEPYIQQASVDKEGNLYLTNGISVIWVLDPEGKPLFNLPLTKRVGSMGMTKEGRMAVVTYDGETQLRIIDAAAKAWGDNFNLEEGTGNTYVSTGIDKSCLISDGDELKEYDLTEGGKGTIILSWLKTGINSQNIRKFCPIEDGRILVQTMDLSKEGNQTEFTVLTKADASAEVQKETLVYAATSVSAEIKEAIVAFNKTNQDYQVEVREYEGDDIQDSVTRMNADIISGADIDIIQVPFGVNRMVYEAKGVFEDLTPYMEADEEVNQESFVQSILNLCSNNGKLYCLPTRYSIRAIAGKESELGNKQGWTLEEFMKYVDSQPDDVKIIEDYGTKTGIFEMCFDYNMEEFINWETGECSFNTDKFIQLLEFANQFPEEMESSANTIQKIRDGKIKLQRCWLHDLESYQVYESVFENDVTFIGFPSASSKGTAVEFSLEPFGISAKSTKKEGAWQFLRTLYAEENQSKWTELGFTVNKKVLERSLQESMNAEYEQDENGEMIIGEDGNPIGIEKTCWITIAYGEHCSVEINAAKQEDVDAVLALIESADMESQWDREIRTLIDEELQSFFKGQKSAAEVAEIIQSRVQIYVSESR